MPSTLRQLAMPALLYASMWLAISVIAASTAYIGLRGSSLSQWFYVFGVMLQFFYTWAFIALGIYWLQRRSADWPLRLWLRLAVHGTLLIVLLLSLPFLIHGEAWRDWLYGDRAAPFHALNAFLYAFALIACTLANAWRLARARESALHEAELRRAELERSLEATRMDALRAQVNPHFLFNALNSLASLIESSSNEEAYDVVERLARLLRNALDYSRDRVVSLQEEMEFLDAYLDIEKIRFQDRLQVVRSIPDDCRTMDVPSFSLQPLVENAIKHAVSKTSEPVTIHVSATCRGERLELRVADNGPGVEPGATPGVGLSNVQSRLHYLFGDEAELELQSDTVGGTVVTLTIPRRSAAHATSAPATNESRGAQDGPVGALPA